MASAVAAITAYCSGSSHSGRDEMAVSRADRLIHAIQSPLWRIAAAPQRYDAKKVQVVSPEVNRLRVLDKEPRRQRKLSGKLPSWKRPQESQNKEYRALYRGMPNRAREANGVTQVKRRLGWD
ncbi:hypothetical protein MY5147_008323 [Beauveria neobassiana]